MRMADDVWNSDMKISDKFTHFIFFYFAIVIGAGLYYFNVLWYIPLLVILGYAKELYDSKFCDGFSWKDLTMDYLGIGLGMALIYNWVPDPIVWMIVLFLYGLFDRRNIRLPFIIK